MTYQLPFAGSGRVNLVVEERGEGQPFLLLHGGAGPASMTRFASLLAERHPVRVITPTHPGFARTERPNELKNIKGLAQLYAAFLDHLGVSDVTVIGNSVGGWIAAELALLANPRVSGIVLVGATGIEVAGHPIPDVSKLTLDEVMSLSYHNPKPFKVDPASVTDDQHAIISSNRAALQVFAASFPLEYPEIEALVVLQRRKFRFAEVPVTMYPRRTGRSSITAFKSLYYIVHVLLGVFVNILKYERRTTGRQPRKK